MSIPLPVRLFHGGWKRGEDGHWTFHRKPSDLGYTVMVKLNEKLEDLENNIRGRYNLTDDIPLALAYHPPMWMLEPEGTRRPPTTLTSTDTVAAMMGIRSWFAELVLCVCSGAQDVAYYQFLCGTTLSVGGAVFVFSGHNDKEIVASKEILEEVFNEEERIAIYRSHYELEKAKQEARQNGSYSAGGTSGVNNEDGAQAPSDSE
ncbi:Uncharacterized protein Rs2_20397 [Raphanus sativus]|uniref:Uncharacterized protein LOC130512726 n=1 Tax=Raphanus sativus TaxID=3726 RepID=A0A9W3DT77_RAPSA|nr:uncharacterized protein LOC130512726 [Raphanus sativus]KAJ4893603.1 Uncharacterized protein Rs2_20397 [Raphanus sativus]